MVVVRVEPGELPDVGFWADEYALSGGNCTWLNWEVETVREVYLDGEGVVGHDRREVCPTETTTYHLDVVYLDGTESRSNVEIVVSAP